MIHIKKDFSYYLLWSHPTSNSIVSGYLSNMRTLQDVPAISDFLFCPHAIPYLIPIFQYIMILHMTRHFRHFIYISVYHAIKTRITVSGYYSWTAFLYIYKQNSKRFWETGRFRLDCIRPIKNGYAFIWIFANNTVFLKMIEKAWINFYRNSKGKSIRMGRNDLKNGYCKIGNGMSWREVWIRNLEESRAV